MDTLAGRHPGDLGHTYGFASVARDGTGNSEGLTAVPDTQTQVVRDTRPPTLHIERQGSTILLCMPRWAVEAGYEIEASSALGDQAQWGPPTEEMIPDDLYGPDVLCLAVDAPVQTRFYRLRKSQ